MTNGRLCLTFDNMGRAREVGLGKAGAPDDNEPSLAIGYPRILAVLKELDLRATFFIEGWNALHHADRIHDLLKRGHEVGLHGWVHENFGALDRRGVEQVLHDGTAAMRRIGVETRGFRAPGGLRGPHALAVLQQLGYRYDSSIDTSGDEDGDFVGTLEPSLLAPGLAHVPWRNSMVDSRQYNRSTGTPPAPSELASRWKQLIDRGVEAGCSMTFVIHAWVSGVDDSRFAAIRDVLTYARGRPGLEFCTAGEQAARV